VIGLGFRLTLSGGREALARLGIIVAAVAVGAGMLLTTLAGINAVNAQNARYAWLETGAGPPTRTGSIGAPGGSDPIWWLLTEDEFRGKVIGRVDVAATGPNSPVPHGLPRLPGPGQFYASPALSTLLRSNAAAELAARYPGRQVGTIGAAGLPSPDSLIMVIGRPAATLAKIPRAGQVTNISTTAPSSCSGPCYAIGIDASGIDLILSIVAAALLFPVLIFIATATRLSAARREQRFAALRLVGATPRQVAVISAVESTLAATLGVAAGFGLFYALRPALAQVPFTGDRFFLADLSLNTPDILLVALAVPAAAAVVARLAMRRVLLSPLGVSRRVTPPAPRAWRVLPLLAGLGELWYFVLAGRPRSTPGQIQAYLTGILLTMAGLILAGPWLTMLVSRLLAHRARTPAALIAARRLADNPQAGFRAISGLVLALFVGTTALAMITTIEADNGGSTNDIGAQRATLVDGLLDYSGIPPRTPVAAIPPTLIGELHAIPGVRAVVTVHAQPSTDLSPNATPFPAPPNAVVSCADLARIPVLGHCAAGAQTAQIDPYLTSTKFAPAGNLWPAATVPASGLAALPVHTLLVGTDGSGAAVEEARTVLEGAYPVRDYAPMTIAENTAQNMDAKRTAAYRRLADVVILASLAIAGCTLAVSVVAGLNDRRRPFSLLRLTGAPMGMLRRVVTLESAVPLLVLAALSAAIAFLTAYLFLRSQLDERLVAPGVEYYGVLAVGLVAALAVIASTMPLLKRITGPAAARNE
jgi:hypothetical protein